MLKNILLIACLAIIGYSCKHERLFEPPSGTTNPPSGGTQPCSTDTVYFTNQILPLINSSCAMSGCHDAISHQDGVILTSYSTIMQQVVAGNPSSSDLYKEIIKTGNDRMPPPPSPAFTQAQKDLVFKWISQGAKNNSCNGCDTTVFTYTLAIAPMMNTYCKGCHNPASLGGGIDLSTYTGVKTVAANGKLYGSITHATGFSAMPKNSAKLSDCQIKQVQKWVAAGALNN